MKFKESSLTLPTILAYAPMAILLSLTGFIYVVYLTTYVLPLATNSYPYDSSTPQSLEEPSQFFIVINTITEFTQRVAVELNLATNGGDTTSKGYTLAIILHVSMLLYLISIFRTIFTNPGSVSDEWNTHMMKEVHEAVETEKRVLRNIRMQLNRRKTEKEGEERKQGEEQKEEGNDRNVIENSNAKSINLEASTQEEEGHLELTAENQALVIEKTSLEQACQGQGGESQASQGQEGIQVAKNTSENVLIELNPSSPQDKPKEDEEGMQKVHQLAVLSALKRGNRRFCVHCAKFKPDRTHHCRQCGTCVLKMDHHCPWISNCVGFYNHKFFMNLVYHGTILLIFVLFTYSEVVKDTFVNPNVSTFKLYLIMVTYLLSIVLAFIMLIFASFHTWIIVNARTTLEYCEGKKIKKYDKGVYKNLQTVLGHNPLLWLVPFCPNTEGGGHIIH